MVAPPKSGSNYNVIALPIQQRIFKKLDGISKVTGTLCFLFGSVQNDSFCALITNLESFDILLRKKKVCFIWHQILYLYLVKNFSQFIEY